MNSSLCNLCNKEFPSRNKLFIHIKEDHADAPQANQSQQQTTQIFSLHEYDKVEILFEDDWSRVIIKPQGMATMGSDDKSLIKHPVLIMAERFEIGMAYRKAIPCHRLDRATGGIVVCSKSKESEICIRLCFRHKLIQKRYRAMVAGSISEDEGFINFPISGKEACTKFKVVERTNSKKYGSITTVDLWPITGRRHQLRKHLQELGHFILGDKRYSHAAQWPGSIDRLFLWAVEIEFPHPKNVACALESMHVDIDDISKEIKNFDSENEDDEFIQYPSKKKARKEKTEIFCNYERLGKLLNGHPTLKICIAEPMYYREFRISEE